MNCSPHTSNSDYTCFTKDELLSIIYAYNESLINKCMEANNKIDNIDSIINLSGIETKKDLWNKIYYTLKPICESEDCWITIDDIKLNDKIRFFTFKPKFINYYGKNEQLDTNDINNVMQQYEKKYNDFHYMGALPCDFYLIDTIDFSKLKKYKYIGIVINLDTHNKSGSHWTSLFINNEDYTIYYFDSLGNKPNKFIKNFIKLYLTKCKKKSYNVYINKHKHQKKNKECGVYAIYFLVKKLENCFYNNVVISDEMMSEYRKNIFR